MRFSEKYGYLKPTEALRRECLYDDCIAGLCTCFDLLSQRLNSYDVSRHNYYDTSFAKLESDIWCFFMNKRLADFWSGSRHEVVAAAFLQSNIHAWYEKFDLIEFAISHLRQKSNASKHQEIVDSFVREINDTFERLKYVYRIVDDQIVEISDSEEISTIEEAMVHDEAIRTHLSSALKHLSNYPTPDYRNSIKESISAVEVLCREITGEDTLGDALKVLEKNGIKIPTFLKSGFEKLYVYTNDKRTGIRHALLDEAEVPQYDEAKYMVVTCSAFVNYIQGKRAAQ